MASVSMSLPADWLSFAVPTSPSRQDKRRNAEIDSPPLYAHSTLRADFCFSHVKVQFSAKYRNEKQLFWQKKTQKNKKHSDASKV